MRPWVIWVCSVLGGMAIVGFVYMVYIQGEMAGFSEAMAGCRR